MGLVTALLGSLAFAAGVGAGAGLVGYFERAGALTPPPRIADQRPFVVVTLRESGPRGDSQDSRAVGPLPGAISPKLAAVPTGPVPPSGESPQTQPSAPSPADTTAPSNPAPQEAPTATVAETEPVVPAAEPGPEADIPVIPAWMLAAVPVPVPQDRPMVAIIIDDLAVDQARSRRAIALPGPLTMSFLPYGNNLDALVTVAREGGHEIMVHLPMEPQDPNADPGPDALVTAQDEDGIRLRLDRNLTAVDGYIGVNNHMGSKFSAWEPGMAVVMEEMRRRGLIYLDSLTTPDTVGAGLAQALNVPYLARDIFLDYDDRPETVAQQLQRLEQIATTRGYAIGIGHPYDATIDEVERWLKTAEERGFAVVPVSAIARFNFALRG